MTIAASTRPIVGRSQWLCGDATTPTMIAHIGANHVPGFAKLRSDALMRAAPRSLFVKGSSIAAKSRAVDTLTWAVSVRISRPLATDVLPRREHGRLVDARNVALAGVTLDVVAGLLADEERNALQQA